jgi:xanthine dehydrogenase accessory factor
MNAEERTQLLSEVERAQAGGAPVAVVTATHPGEPPLAERGAKLLVRRDPHDSSLGTLGAPALDALVAEAAREALRAHSGPEVQTLYIAATGSDDGRRLTDRRHESAPGDAQLMLELFEAPARLVVVGGGHVGRALAEMGAILGLEVTVLDDRPEFANAERFPMAQEVRAGEIDVELDAMDLAGACSVVLVSRGHKQDELALRHSVGRRAAYVGMIGSRRRTRTVLESLAADGVDAAELARVHTPIGLDIGAETPEEITISILAEIVMVRRGGTGAPMRPRDEAES